MATRGHQSISFVMIVASGARICDIPRDRRRWRRRMASASQRQRRAPAESARRHGAPRLLAMTLLTLTLLLASCATTTTPPVVIPRLGQGAAGALAYAATVNGPDSWAWKISVPKN